jgi:hypothetical protein
MKYGLSLLSCALGACAPAIPFHFAETAETLKARQVSLTVAGGGGGGRDIHECCGGGSARVRVGIGHNMEVGGELDAIGGKGTAVLSGKASFKFAPVDYFALIAGVGGSGTINTSGEGSSPLYLGTDVAALFSSRPLANLLRLYGGARFTFVLPTSGQFYQNLPTQGFIVPVGLALALSPRWRLFFESGMTGGWSELANNMTNQIDRFNWIGGYGAIATSITWGK